MWLTRSTSKTRHPRSHTSPGPHDAATPYPRTIHILRAERRYRGGPRPGDPRTPPGHPAGCGSVCTDTRPSLTPRSPAVGAPELLVPGRRGVRSSARDPPSRPCWVGIPSVVHTYTRSGGAPTDPHIAQRAACQGTCTVCWVFMACDASSRADINTYFRSVRGPQEVGGRGDMGGGYVWFPPTSGGNAVRGASLHCMA